VSHLKDQQVFSATRWLLARRADLLEQLQVCGCIQLRRARGLKSIHRHPHHCPDPLDRLFDPVVAHVAVGDQPSTPGVDLAAEDSGFTPVFER